MKRLFLALLVAIPLAAAPRPASAQQAAAANSPAVGEIAPDFTLNAATRFGVLANPVKLSDFRGKTVVLAFFPAARSRGCTIQMRSYRDQYQELFNGGKDIVLIAISTDPVETLHSWAAEEDFPFLMASDNPMSMATVYGATLTNTRTNRNLFVVDPDGKIAYKATPFLELDPTAYEDLGTVLKTFSAN